MFKSRKRDPRKGLFQVGDTVRVVRMTDDVPMPEQIGREGKVVRITNMVYPIEVFMEDLNRSVPFNENELELV